MEGGVVVQFKIFFCLPSCPQSLQAHELRKIKNTMKTLGQYIRPVGQYLNLGPLEHETGLLTTKLQCSTIAHFTVGCC